MSSHVFLLGPRLLDLGKLHQCQRKLEDLQAWFQDYEFGGDKPTNRLERKLVSIILERHGRDYGSQLRTMDFDAAFRSLERQWPNGLSLSAQVNINVPYERVVALTMTNGTDTKGGAKTLLKWIWRLGLLKNIGMGEL